MQRLCKYSPVAFFLLPRYFGLCQQLKPLILLDFLRREVPKEYLNILCVPNAGKDLKSHIRKDVRVRTPSPAPKAAGKASGFFHFPVKDGLHLDLGCISFAYDCRFVCLSNYIAARTCGLLQNQTLFGKIKMVFCNVIEVTGLVTARVCIEGVICICLTASTENFLKLLAGPVRSWRSFCRTG